MGTVLLFPPPPDKFERIADDMLAKLSLRPGIFADELRGEIARLIELTEYREALDVPANLNEAQQAALAKSFQDAAQRIVRPILKRSFELAARLVELRRIAREAGMTMKPMD